MIVFTFKTILIIAVIALLIIFFLGSVVYSGLKNFYMIYVKGYAFYEGEVILSAGGIATDYEYFKNDAEAMEAWRRKKDMITRIAPVEKKLKPKRRKFDVYSEDFIRVDRPDIKFRTQERLARMADLGMEIDGIGCFGIPGVMNGLYIEKVWTLTDEEFDDYMKWVESLIKKDKWERK